ncbi:MAG TPA: GntR family transcriptional regulator YhfZ [Pseudogracilibacillus sp.]|nr:GntR family transcriptional regulator YhfZ [Pseudogracilibacillus sp.]
MHYRYIDISIELARRLLLLNNGDRIDSVKKLSEEFNVGRGTIQTALNRLIEDGALEIESFAQRGSYLKNINRTLLLKHAELEEIVGMLPITYSLLHQGLATGLYEAFENTDISILLAQLRGAKRRLKFLKSSKCDFIIISKMTWNNIKKDDSLTLLMDFGKQSNVSNHVLLVRSQFINGFVKGMRVGIDSTSVDHAQLTYKKFANQSVEFIETSYGNTIDKLVTGEIDATIWDASISYLPKSVSMLPLKQDEESPSSNTISCLIGKKSNQALNQLLIEYINPYAVKNIQNLVLTKKKTPLF